MDVSTITAAMAGANAAVGLIKSAFSARDQALLDKAESALLRELVGVSNSALALVGQNAALMEDKRKAEEELRKLKEFSRDMSGYELYETPARAICYRPKPDHAERKMSVYLCAACVSDGQKTYLQPLGASSDWRECKRGHGAIQVDRSSGRRSRADSDWDPYEDGR